MKLSLADKIALMYTGLGSQRSIAQVLGISHQKVGRILKTGSPELGGFAENSRALKDPALIAAVDRGLALHTEMARNRAKFDKLPFDSSLPVFYRRLPRIKYQTIRQIGTDGKMHKTRIPVLDDQGRAVREPGERVAAEHTHWLSDRLRNAWIASKHKSGKFYHVSIRSLVNLVQYNKQANARQKESGVPRTKEQRQWKREIEQRIKAKAEISQIYTRYAAMDPEHHFTDVLDEVNSLLRTKHEPATGERGTQLADEILFQLDTRKVKNGNRSVTRKAQGGRKRSK